MNPEQLEAEMPYTFIELARAKVLMRKKNKNFDVIFNFSAFLNFRLKMSYAVCVFVLSGFCILYLTNPGFENQGQSMVGGEMCDMLSVKNSTLLPGITTFIFN